MTQKFKILLVRGSDGRKPFHPKEETSLLIELRKKKVWPCFIDSNTKIGVNGFRGKGYHEQTKEPLLLPVTLTTKKELLSEFPSLVLPNVQPKSTKSKNKLTKKYSGSLGEGRSRYLSSFEVFQMFAPPDEFGSSRILSKECFELWVKTRRNGLKSPEHSFRKALIAHRKS